MGKWIPIIVVLVLLIVLIVMIYIGVNYLRRKFRELFGVSTIKQLNEQRELEAQAPKSVSSMTKFYLPQILNDFPDFNWEMFKLSAQNTIKSTLLAMSTHNVQLLPKEADSALKEQVELSITDDDMGGVHTHYDDIDIHDTQIISYVKQKGMCVIKMQSAVGHIYWQEKDGSVIMGSKDVKLQTKYESSMIYIQNPDEVENSKELALGLTCPSCGAAISSLGVKFCEYCGAGVVEYIRKVWRFGAIKKL